MASNERWQAIETAPKDGTVLEVPLTKGLVAIIDEADYALINGDSWHATPRRDGKGWYAKSARGIRMHRLLMGVNDSRIVDHVDGNGLNNRRSNLRVGTQSQNCVNRLTTPGTSPRGVRKKKDLYQAYIKYQGRQRSLGYFKTQEEAHATYLTEATRLHGNWMPLPPPPTAGGAER